jgi:hypothetical protein
MRWVNRCAWSTAAVALAAALSGCGMPGAPLPPSLNLAQPVTNLVATRTGSQVSLSWTMPKKNTDKLLLKGNVEVRVCRSEGAAGSCTQAGNLQLEPGAEGAFSETLPQPLTLGAPRVLRFFVELKNRNGRSAGMSNAAIVLAGEAPGPVTGLVAEVRKAGVVLRWSPPEPSATPTAIRLHRKLLTPQHEQKSSRQNGPLGALLAPAPEPPEQNLLVEVAGKTPDRALDKDVRLGEAYEYRVQRVARISVDSQTLELDGVLTAPLSVEVRDVFPPAVPAGLAAVAIAAENGGSAAIDLSWQPDTESDLAGYIVYRREGTADWQRISPAEPVVGPAFHDARVLAGHTYTYTVTAIDQSGHESSRSDEAAETVPNP